MKITDVKKRLAKDRPMITISMCIPEDVIEDLKRIAPLLGFSGYQSLIRVYVGRGLRTDMAKLEQENAHIWRSAQTRNSFLNKGKACL